MNHHALALCAAVAVGGCTHHPVFMDAQVEYPRLPSRTCGRPDRLAGVDVVVHDAEGAAIPERPRISFRC